ncbi:hypothetical protein ACP4OV_012098 [Aristida adscensionis]
MAPPRPSPELMDELLGEILLRLPPSDPACLVRASLVCRPWRLLLRDAAFLRRYREHHRAPPLLGFFHNLPRSSGGARAPRFVPTAAPSPVPHPPPPPLAGRDSLALDCRHGRVLLLDAGGSSGGGFAVWVPITGERRALPGPGVPYTWCSAVVLCAAAGGRCDHRHCHGGPFLVVLVASSHVDPQATTSALVYSSAADAWSSSPASIRTGPTSNAGFSKAGVVSGDEIYFTLRCDTAILKYDLQKHRLSVISPPEFYGRRSILTLMEDGSLGFAGISYPRLELWSRRKLDPQAVVASWVRCRVIDLTAVLPFVDRLYQRGELIGSAQGLGVIFLSTNDAVFVIEFESGRVIRRVHESLQSGYALPYMEFYTPGSYRP